MQHGHPQFCVGHGTVGVCRSRFTRFSSLHAPTTSSESRWRVSFHKAREVASAPLVRSNSMIANIADPKVSAALRYAVSLPEARIALITDHAVLVFSAKRASAISRTDM